MSEGPMIYGRLMDFACDQLRIDIEKRLVASAQDNAAAIASLLGKAYQEGLRDGFQQGVQFSSENAG